MVQIPNVSDTIGVVIELIVFSAAEVRQPQSLHDARPVRSTSVAPVRRVAAVAGGRFTDSWSLFSEPSQLFHVVFRVPTPHARHGQSILHAMQDQRGFVYAFAEQLVVTASARAQVVLFVLVGEEAAPYDCSKLILNLGEFGWPTHLFAQRKTWRSLQRASLLVRLLRCTPMLAH